ncbi:hypothetical protein PSTT_04782, partial [Puccinia striiformis]
PLPTSIPLPGLKSVEKPWWLVEGSLSRQKTILSPRREGMSMTVLGWHHVTVDPTGYSPDLHHWGR